MKLTTERPTLVSLFCGCGGLDLGFREHFSSLASYDHDEAAIANYELNFTARPFTADLSCNLPQEAYKIRPDVVIAGPPCQGFSTIGQRNFDDPRNNLLLKCGEHAVMFAPKCILIENVVGAVSGKHREYWDKLESFLLFKGYQCKTFKLSADQFGVPQSRRRIILIAWKSKKTPEFNLVVAPRPLESYLSNLKNIPNHIPERLKVGSTEEKIAKKIKQGQKLCDVRASDRCVHSWQIPEVFGATNAKERAVLMAVQKLRRRERKRDFGDADPVDAKSIDSFLKFKTENEVSSLIKKGYLIKVSKNIDLARKFNGKYRRLTNGGTSYTVDTRFGDPTCFLHPIFNRGLTVREAARIQGFPDSYQFIGTRAQQFRVIGNAVPPPMAAALAIEILKMLKS